MEICTVFIVEDDLWYGEVIEYQLTSHPNCKVFRFYNGQECLDNLHRIPHLIIASDLLPDMSAQQLFQSIKEKAPSLPVIVMSSEENISSAVCLIKMGVHDYLLKDDSIKDRIFESLVLLAQEQQHQTNVQAQQLIPTSFAFDQTIQGNTTSIVRVRELMEKAAKTHINVSIAGEIGTGKATIAKAIHNYSTRADKPFISINVSTTPKHLIERELFGQRNISFPSATPTKMGLLELAHTGTLYIEEIQELEMGLQHTLLQTLQDKEFSRLSGNEKTHLDIRLIVGSRKNLAEELSKGHLYEELYYLIVGLPIEVPPLKERDADIILLARHFLDEYCRQNNLGFKKLSDCTIKKLLAYSFPGNIQELKAVIELAAVLCDDHEVTDTYIVFNKHAAGELRIQEDKTMKEYNISIIQHYMKKYDRNVLRVAKTLDIGKSTIYKMIQRNELQHC